MGDVQFKMKDISKLIQKDELDKLAGQILLLVLQNTAAGIASTSSTQRRYEKYKDKTKYPAKLKPSRPVNLRLTGKMLDSLEANVSTDKDGAHIYLNFKDADQAAKYTTHHNGLRGVPQRQILPYKRGEKFSKVVEKEILKGFDKLVSKSLKKFNA